MKKFVKRERKKNSGFKNRSVIVSVVPTTYLVTAVLKKRGVWWGVRSMKNKLRSASSLAKKRTSQVRSKKKIDIVSKAQQR